MKNKIVWTEGLFLKPHHLQQQERYFENLLHNKTALYHHNGWGIISLSINKEMLNLGKISLIDCQALFADGTFYQAPGQDQLPDAFDVPNNLSNGLIYLALPLLTADKPSISLQKGIHHCRYSAQFTQINNNIEDQDNPCETQIASLKPKILCNTAELPGYTVIPFLKIKEIRSNQMIVLDQDYMAPTVKVVANDKLQTFLKEVYSLIQHRADMLAERLANTQQSASTEIADFLLLQVLNRFEPLFAAIDKHCYFHPEYLFLTLTQFCGELATFTKDNRRPNEAPPYQHQHQNTSFEPIMEQCRAALSMVLEQNAHPITLIEHEFGVWTGQINKEQLSEEANFILAVNSSIGAEVILQQLPNQIKIASPGLMKQLISRALPGIEIQALTIAPRQIPYHANFSYFLINKNHEYWSQIMKSNQIALHIGGQFPELKLELWSING